MELSFLASVLGRPSNVDIVGAFLLDRNILVNVGLLIGYRSLVGVVARLL